MNSLLEKAAARVDQAKQALNEALVNGADSSTAREVLSLAEQDLARVAAAVAEQGAANEASAGDALADEAGRLVEATLADIEGELSDLAAVPLPLLELPHGTARQLCQAHARRDGHLAAAREHEARLSSLRARLAALDEQRAQIGARRLAGDGKPTDEAAVYLIELDRSGLARLVAEAQAAAPTFDHRILEHAERLWADAIRSARLAALNSLARDLESRLVAAVDQAEQLAGVGRIGSTWMPGNGLRWAFQRRGIR